MLFRSARSDEDGGYPANIAASGSEQIKHSAMREQRKSSVEDAVVALL
jgi:hypothetical protein